MPIAGIIPAAGVGSRMQPLAFSKELLPVGGRPDDGGERPRAVSEYIVERMLRAGASKLCFVISPGKHDILEYYGGRVEGADVCYVVQPRPAGLCDAIFRALPWIGPREQVLVGLPDTVWFPEDALCDLPDGALSFLLFLSDHPELFDAVATDGAGNVTTIRVKAPVEGPAWIWGAFKLPVALLDTLHELWQRRDRADEYVGTLVNAYLAAGGSAAGIHAGGAYVDVGTLHGYRQAIEVLSEKNTHMAKGRNA